MGTQDSRGNWVFDWVEKGLSNEDKAKIDKDIEYLKNKLKSLSPETKTWKEYFEEITGVTGNTGYEMGNYYMSQYAQKYNSEINRKKTIGTYNENTEKELAEQYISEIEKQIYDLLDNRNLDEPFELTDKSIQGMIETISMFKKTLEETNQELETTFYSIITGLKSTGDVGDYLKGSLLEMVGGFGELGKVTQALITGDVMGLIQVGVDALGNVISNLEGANEVFNFVTEAFGHLAPFLQYIINIISPFIEIIVALFEMLNSLLMIFEPIFQVLEIFAKAIGTVVKAIITVIDMLFKWISDLPL